MYIWRGNVQQMGDDLHSTVDFWRVTKAAESKPECKDIDKISAFRDKDEKQPCFKIQPCI